MALATQTGSLWNNLLISVTSLHSHREVLGSLSLKQAPDPLGFVCVCLYFFSAMPRGMWDLSSPTRD